MDDLKGTRVLVTGAAGFLGANLTRELVRRKAEVHAWVRSSTDLWRIAEVSAQLNLHRVDLTCREAVRRAVEAIRPKVVFHLAGPHEPHPCRPEDREDTLRICVLGTANLLEAVAPQEFNRFVCLGSSLEYGPRGHPLKESDPLQPTTFRGAAKAASTLLCLQFAQATGRPVVVLRVFSAYGYWEAATRFVPTAIRAALGNQEVALTAPGLRRDWVFVEDVVEACLLAVSAKRAPGRTINVGSGQQWSNEEVVALIENLSGKKMKVRVGAFPARASDTTHWVANIQAAKQLLAWSPRHTLRDGLEKTLSWFRLHQDAYLEKDGLSLAQVSK